MNVHIQGQKQRTAAIRATPAQFSLLKAAYSVSYAPSTRVIEELSRQTGLPEKWINNWFGRQRTKSRKNGEVIDMTTGSSDSFLEHILSYSSSPIPADQEAVVVKKEKITTSRRQAPARPSKPKGRPRKAIKPEPCEEKLPNASTPTIQVPRGQPPQLLPSVVSSGIQPQSLMQPMQLPVLPPTRAGIPPRPQFDSIHSQISAEDAETLHGTGMYSSFGCFAVPLYSNAQTDGLRRQGPTIRGDSGGQMLPELFSVYPASSPASKGVELESQLPSSPAPPSEGFNYGFPYTHLLVDPSIPSAPASIPLSAQRALPAFHSQALAAYTAMYNKNPAAYQAMLMNYAALFPALLPGTTGPVPAPGSANYGLETSTDIPLSITTTSSSATSSLPDHNPRLPPLNLDGELELSHTPYGPSIVKQEEGTPWQSNDDYLDFSSLHYDYAPLNHLQERLQPFRLPESEYLFGKDAVVNHLLDERFGEEEPFHAAMGLVLLSRLGFKW